MRKPLIVVTLVTAGVFATGYLVGQLEGAMSANAASKHATVKGKGHSNRGWVSDRATPGAHHADGSVTAVNGNTITVKADNDPAGSNEYTGLTTIVLSSSTTFTGGTTRASIVVGARIVAEGTVSSDGTTLTATSVGVGNHFGGGPGHGHGGPHADGSVVSVSGNTITVEPDTDVAGSDEYSKVTTVLLTSSTTYGFSSTRPTIAAGSKFIAEGTLSADGAILTATRFYLRGSDAQFGGHEFGPHELSAHGFGAHSS